MTCGNCPLCSLGWNLLCFLVLCISGFSPQAPAGVPWGVKCHHWSPGSMMLSGWGRHCDNTRCRWLLASGLLEKCPVSVDTRYEISGETRPGPLLTSLSAGLLLLFSWVTLAQPSNPSALAHHPHLCQTTRDADGRHHPGFFCPRLSDPPEEAYCCRPQAAGRSCCTRAEFEARHQVNLSALPPPPVLRGPGPLLALGLYSLLLVALMTADLLHFCRGRGRTRPPTPSWSSAARPLQVPAGAD